MNLDFIFTGAQSLFTLLSFLTFVGIVIWSYSARQKNNFADAANLPFADEAEDDTVETKVHHG